MCIASQSFTDSNSRQYTETVNLTVTNNAIADVGTITLDSEFANRGRSNINLNQDNNNNTLDFTQAATLELLSAGAQSFITRQGGAASTFAFFELAATPEGVTGSKNAAAGDTDGDGTNDVVLTAAGAIGGASALSAANSLLLGDDIGNETITLKITLGNNTVLNTAATTEKFEEYLTINITDNGAGGTGAYVQGTGRTESTGSRATYTGTSDGDAKAISLADRTLFAELVAYTDANAGGSFAITRQQSDRYGSGGTALAADQNYALDGNTLTLDAGADAGQRFLEVTYTDLDGNTFFQQIDYTTTAATNPSTATVTQVSTNATKDASAQSTEINGGKSVIQVAEASEGTIAKSILSPQLGTFENAHAGGTFSLTGTDASSFELDKNGNLTSKVIMNFEEKPQFNLNLVYTQGDNVYTETIVLNVQNNTADDGDHIENVNIGTQAGAQSAINILDTALNLFTAAQAKLG